MESIKNGIRCIFFVLLLSGSLFAASFSSTSNVSATQNSAQSDIGYLNVFTDLDHAQIVVDGEIAGKESLVKFPIQAGEHFVQVKIDNQIVYQQQVMINPRRTSTVTSDHFVDLKTNTPSRGAIDREAKRLRESRGNFGLGLHITNLPQPAASVKWWAIPHFGVQGLFLGNIPGNEIQRGIFGARLLASPGDKVFISDIISTYGYVGAGRYITTLNPEGKGYMEGGIGVELNLGPLASFAYVLKQALRTESSSIKKTTTKVTDSAGNTSTVDSTSYNLDWIVDLLTLGVLNLCYTSFEVGVISRDSGPAETQYSLGLHVYF